MDFNELYRKAREGDKGAEASLFSGLGDRFRLLVHHKIWDRTDGEDVVQEALMTVAREYRQVEITTSFIAWAHKILHFRMLSYFKAKKTMDSRISRSATDYDAESWDPDPILKRQLQECLRLVYDHNPRYARILALHYQGFTKDETCRKLELSANAYYVLLSRARAQLGQCLEGNGDR